MSYLKCNVNQTHEFNDFKLVSIFNLHYSAFI